MFRHDCPTFNSKFPTIAKRSFWNSLRVILNSWTVRVWSLGFSVLKAIRKRTIASLMEDNKQYNFPIDESLWRTADFQVLLHWIIGLD